MKMYNVSSSPHVKTKTTTQTIMRDVIIAMVPAAAYGIYNAADLFGVKYGIRAAMLLVLTIASCMLSEYVFEKITKRETTLSDLSAVVTGMILALNLPCTFPFWKAVLGGAFAIVIVKQLFGGLGQNFMNPALGARCFLSLSFAADMTAFFPRNLTDAVSSATPLTALKNSGEMITPVSNLLLGNYAGTIGETSVIALLIGAIPLTYLLVFCICILLFNGSTDVSFLAAHLFGGGLIFGAFFMATDYATSPLTKRGRYLFGICLGLLTALFRTFGANAEGVSFAIIFCNLLVPLIEKYTIPRAFGVARGGK